MATVRKLADEEVTRFARRGTRVDLSDYEAALQELAVGDWGAVELEPGDRVPTVKRRATSAARGQGKRLAWRRERDGLLPFEVRAAEIAAAPARGRGQGRSRTGGGGGRRRAGGESGR